MLLESQFVVLIQFLVEQQSGVCGLRPLKICHIFSGSAKQLILLMTLVLTFWYQRC